MQQRRAPALDPQAAKPGQDWMRCGGTLRLGHRPIGKRRPQFKGRIERNLSPRPETSAKINKSVATLKRRLMN
jgi:hypothetical protein